MDYVYFSVRVFENKYLDGEQLKDSWRDAVKQFVHDVNTIVQDMSIRLVALLLLALQYLLYFFILLFIAKFVWKATKRIWRS